MAKKLLSLPCTIQLLLLSACLLPIQLSFAQSLPVPFQIIQKHHYLGRNFTQDQYSLAAAEGAAKLFYPTVLLLKQQPAQKSPPKTQQSFSMSYSSNSIATISEIDFSSPAIATQILSALRKEKIKSSLNAILLDLRGISDFENYHQAARICSLFLPPEKDVLILDGGQNGTLETFRTNETEPTFSKIPLCVIVDARTAGTAEILAEILSVHGRTLIIGEPTKAMTYTYFTTPFQDGLVFTVANAIALVPASPKKPLQPLTPDILTTSDLSLTAATDFLNAMVNNLFSELASPIN